MNKVFETNFIRTTAASLALVSMPDNAPALEKLLIPNQEPYKISAMPDMPFEENGSSGERTISFAQLPLSEWTKKHEKEFRELAMLHSTEKATFEQERRLSRLEHQRQIATTNRTAAEIELELRQNKILRDMEAVLKNLTDPKYAAIATRLASRQKD